MIRGLDASAAAALAIGRAIHSAATPRRRITPGRARLYSDNGDTIGVITFEIDNRAYIRAMEQIRRMEERAARQREAVVMPIPGPGTP